MNEPKNFIKANNKFINLEHVSSINVLSARVAFDMDCPVELDDKVISYYAYNDLESRMTFKDLEYVNENFVSHNNVYINTNHVSAITFREDKLRIIFNLSHSTTSSKYNGESRLTSKFIYFDFNSITEYNDFAFYLSEKINIK